jgi:hypothetical protein
MTLGQRTRSSPFVRAGYYLLGVAASVSALTLVRAPEWALLPPVVLLGWVQIGGL